MKAELELSKALCDTVWEHLLPIDQIVEQGAFLYATRVDSRLQIIGWEPVLSDDFAIQTAFHIELTDAVRARVIKRAHDLGTSLVEVHSHLGTSVSSVFAERPRWIQGLGAACSLASERQAVWGVGGDSLGI